MNKNKKRFTIVIGVLLLLLACTIIICVLYPHEPKIIKIKDEPPVPEKSLMEHEEYKDITIDNIKSIEIKRYTEGGVDTNSITNIDDINRTYNYLKNKKIGKEVQTACEDNTTIYEFRLTDDNIKTLEIECDWVIIKNKRYSIE